MDYVASAVMQKDVKTVTPSMTVAQLEAAFVQHQVSGFPVVDDGKLVGVVSRTDLLRALSPECDLTHMEFSERAGEPPGGPGVSATLGDRDNLLTVQDVMTTDVVTVEPNDRLHDVADLMYGKRIHRIVVVEGGVVRGVITPFDFVRLYSNDRIGVEGRPIRTKDF